MPFRCLIIAGFIFFSAGRTTAQSKKDDVYISFGFQDNSAFLLKTDKDFIDNLLIEI